jgi:methyl-accepting chemotaxis protein
VVAEDGIFVTHRGYLEAMAHIERLQNTVTATTQDYIAALDSAAEAAANIITQAQKDTTRGVMQAQQGIGALVLMGLGIGLVLGLVLVRSITKPIRQLSAMADQIAQGDVNVVVDVNTKDEIGQLENAFQTMVAGLKAQVHVAEQIAAGDLTVEVHARSQADALAVSMRQVLTTLRGLEEEIQGLVNRRHCVPDQFARPECCGRGSPGWRCGEGFCGRRRGGTESGHAER